jgi:cob(I)alamin adenosyltransferase
MKKGLVILHTGHGKGKTTAALGLTLRAAGHGLKTCFIQFIKGKWEPGEKKALELLNGSIDFFPMGEGFISHSMNVEKDKQLARDAWLFSREMIAHGGYNMVVLDELTWLFFFKILAPSEVIEVLRKKPEKLHVVITGRDAPKAIIEAADLVTEMQNVRHPYREQGIKAQKGIEF